MHLRTLSGDIENSDSSSYLSYAVTRVFVSPTAMASSRSTRFLHILSATGVLPEQSSTTRLSQFCKEVEAYSPFSYYLVEGTIHCISMRGKFDLRGMKVEPDGIIDVQGNSSCSHSTPVTTTKP
jgi:hypothetical protein